ncbi:MAG TPA: phosphodiester glycosidase family protein [Marmoricola sp.]|nr:phosphodiester glycosidase family protein [Marmoricola sp.]
MSPQRSSRRRAAPRARTRTAFPWGARWFLVLTSALTALVVWLAWSVGSALTAPGNDPVAARLAEWARDHGMAVLVLALEKLNYDVHQPRVGGTPSLRVLQAGDAQGSHRHARSTVALQSRMRPIVSPPLPHEGSWRVLVSVHHQPAVQAAYVRPDPQHTSYLTGVAWLSHRLLRFELHPGWDQPGGTWRVPDWIAPGRRRGLAATWNGAFKLGDAHGGFYLDGRTVGTLRRGAASEVFYRNGSMTVGSWGKEVRMTPSVVGVRQNLGMLIDHGRIAGNVTNNVEFNWGLTLGGAYYIFRSGVGVTRQGDVVYASGDALSAYTLARVLKRAGCVRAMELDINPAWVSFMSYHAGSHPARPTPRLLLPDYQRPANRYFTHTSRDFVAAYARPGR